jgi:uncharacterized protein (TIGR02145 family)
MVLFCYVIAFLADSYAQIAVNTDGSQPDPSAMLDVKSPNTGLLIPRMSYVDRNLIPSPATGLLIYDTTSNLFDYYNGSSWYQLESAFVSSTAGTVSPGGGVSINASPNVPANNSAMLDIKNQTRGILIPRTIPGLITSPATGLLIYNSSTNMLNFFDGTRWTAVCSIYTGVPAPGGSQAAVGMAVNTNTSGPHQSAMLDISATDKGFLIPRLANSQRDALLPVKGLVIYNTSSNGIEFYNGTGWYRMVTDYLVPPTEGIHVPSTNQITWNWNTVPGASGYKWNTTPDFNTATNMGTSTTKTETGLACNTSYTRYVWAYTSCGNSSPRTLTQSTSSNCPWSCGQAITDSRDAKTYNTVLIGTRCWMAQNLNVGTRIDHSNDQTNNSTIEKYCYNDNDANCSTYGGLYQWDEVMNYTASSSSNPSGRQGICPAGWHLPSDAEWCQMEVFLDATVACSDVNSGTDAGGKMKQTFYAYWHTPNTGATNSSGFTALPGGSKQSTWYGLNYFAYFWSSTEDTYTLNAWGQDLWTGDATVTSYPFSKSYGFSCRCVKD